MCIFTICAVARNLQFVFLLTFTGQGSYFCSGIDDSRLTVEKEWYSKSQRTGIGRLPGVNVGDLSQDA